MHYKYIPNTSREESVKTQENSVNVSGAIMCLVCQFLVVFFFKKMEAIVKKIPIYVQRFEKKHICLDYGLGFRI